MAPAIQREHETIETQLRAYDGVGGTHALKHARELSKERTDYSILVRRFAV